MELINKSAVVADIERRRDESWLGEYTKEKGIIFDITDEILSFIDTLEVKEVDLKKEVNSQMDLLCNLLCYMDELSNGDSEGVYPLPINVKEDLQRFAKHFFELGLKAKGE